VGELTEQERDDAEALAVALGESFGYAGVTRWRAVPVAEQLVVDGWTHVGPGERVVREPTPRDPEFNLRDELAATIAGAGLVHGPVGLAEYLLGEGWMKLEPGQRIISNEDAILLAQLKAAVSRWESLKKTAKENQAEGAEVSADASELTSGVKLASREAQILTVFAATDRPLYFPEAAERAAGRQVSTQEPEVWDLWSGAFRSLVQRGLIEAPPAPKGTVRRYQLTAAGRDLQAASGMTL